MAVELVSMTVDFLNGLKSLVTAAPCSYQCVAKFALVSLCFSKHILTTLIQNESLDSREETGEGYVSFQSM